MREPKTLCELFQNSLVDHPRERAYLEKQHGHYRALGSREIAARVQAVTSALRQTGVQPGDRVAIISPNRLEWAIADYAILHCGAVTVPVYQTLQAAAVQHILGDCDATLAFVADAAQLAKLGTSGQLPRLQHAVVFDDTAAATTPEAAVAAEPARPTSRWCDFATRGALWPDGPSFAQLWQTVRADDLATLIYTSGTTGIPKGVMLTHANIVSNVLSVLRRFRLGPGDTYLSFLPLAHILERMAGQFVMWHAGACIAYAESFDTVPQNFLEVRPTITVCVPRVLEKFYGRAQSAAAAAPPWRRKLFGWAMAVGRQRLRAQQEDHRVSLWLSVQDVIADRLVFSKLRARLGGRLRFMISGGAPLSRAIGEFFHAARLCIVEGYGLTETSPVIALNPPERPRLGSVGPPVDGVEVRIADDGEILVRGPNVMRGYYGMPHETEQVLADGWFRTGDVGRLDTAGYLCVTDRKKDLLVTSGGKNVAPQPIESHLKALRFIAEAVLVGDGQKYVSALVVPQFTALRDYARSTGLDVDDAALVRAPQILQLYETLIGQVNGRLAPYERIKRFCLLERELQLESGEVTPTMKVKRNVVVQRYADCIQRLYSDPPPAGVGCPATGASTPSTDTPP